MKKQMLKIQLIWNMKTNLKTILKMLKTKQMILFKQRNCLEMMTL